MPPKRQSEVGIEELDYGVNRMSISSNSRPSSPTKKQRIRFADNEGDTLHENDPKPPTPPPPPPFPPGRSSRTGLDIRNRFSRLKTRASKVLKTKKGKHTTTTHITVDMGLTPVASNRSSAPSPERLQKPVKLDPLTLHHPNFRFDSKSPSPDPAGILENMPKSKKEAATRPRWHQPLKIDPRRGQGYHEHPRCLDMPSPVTLPSPGSAQGLHEYFKPGQGPNDPQPLINVTNTISLGAATVKKIGGVENKPVRTDYIPTYPDDNDSLYPPHAIPSLLSSLRYPVESPRQYPVVVNVPETAALKEVENVAVVDGIPGYSGTNLKRSLRVKKSQGAPKRSPLDSEEQAIFDAGPANPSGFSWKFTPPEYERVLEPSEIVANPPTVGSEPVIRGTNKNVFSKYEDEKADFFFSMWPKAARFLLGDQLTDDDLTCGVFPELQVRRCHPMHEILSYVSQELNTDTLTDDDVQMLDVDEMVKGNIDPEAMRRLMYAACSSRDITERDDVIDAVRAYVGNWDYKTRKILLMEIVEDVKKEARDTKFSVQHLERLLSSEHLQCAMCIASSEDYVELVAMLDVIVLCAFDTKRAFFARRVAMRADAYGIAIVGKLVQEEKWWELECLRLFYQPIIAERKAGFLKEGEDSDQDGGGRFGAQWKSESYFTGFYERLIPCEKDEWMA